MSVFALFSANHKQFKLTSCDDTFFTTAVKLWLELALHQMRAVSHGNGKDGAEKVRDVFERALSRCALHCTEASLLWEAYIDYEVGCSLSFLLLFFISILFFFLLSFIHLLFFFFSLFLFFLFFSSISLLSFLFFHLFFTFNFIQKFNHFNPNFLNII